MSDQWISQEVALKFMISDLTLCTKKLQLKVRRFETINPAVPILEHWIPQINLSEDEKGYLLRSLPLSQKQPKFKIEDGFIYYIPTQFDRYYIDFRQSFDDYKSTFSAKTRATIKRKIKKFNAFCNDAIEFKVYRSKQELQEFYQLAREVSSKTYQEKLLNAGLPDTVEFTQEMLEKAQNDNIRAYLLFNKNIPVAYMYCPVYDNILLYQYLGYDPDYMKWSVGTILHWFVFEDLFKEARFSYFDFTEGQSEHKRLYSTNSILCGNIFILQSSNKMRFWIRSHLRLEAVSNSLGNMLERWGLKAKLKKLIRFKFNRT